MGRCPTLCNLKAGLYDRLFLRHSPGMAKNKSIPELSAGLAKQLDESVNGHIGVDEAGRGCLAGPVCAAALYAPADFDFAIFPGLTDSKKLSETRRDKLESLIKAAPELVWAIGLSWPEEIDRVNILNATFRAMSRALLGLKFKLGAYPVFIDGPHTIPLPQWQAARQALPPEPPRFFPVIKGDSLVPAISAASILAKVQRDRLMRALARRYPQYSFEKHKGYGTREHMDAIASYGSSPLHRLSFGEQRGEEQLNLF